MQEKSVVMLKNRVIICTLLIALSITGCTVKTSKNSTPSVSTSEQTSIVLGDIYTRNITAQEFYCMKVNGNYYKIVYPANSDGVVVADDPSLLPDIEDGQFVLVTADVEETISDFGYVPVITLISTKITDLQTSETKNFKNIVKNFNLPSADDEEINKACNLFQYTHKGKLYLIFVNNGHVTAYSKNGLLIDYEPEDGEEMFKEFFKAL